MFIGHFAVGFASKKLAPRTNLATLMIAPLWLDALWPVFLLLGWEHVRIAPGDTPFTPLDFYDYPWSHSLLMSIVWASLFAFVYYGFARYKTGAIVVWVGVISHWVLDWATHRPDLPLYPGGPKFGLGLWNSIPGTLIVELLMFGVGIWLYVQTTRARDRIGKYAFWAYIGLLLLLYAGDRFSDPPPNAKGIAWTGVAAFVILIPWTWWFDHHRTLREP